MPWVKIPEENHTVFVAALPADDRIETKKMFGGLAAMMNGQMMAGLFATTAVVKLSAEDQSALARLGGVPFDPMGNGRRMADTLVLPESEFADRARLRGWLAKACDHVATLPAKVTKPAAAKKAAASKSATTKRVPATASKSAPKKSRPR